MLSSAACAGDDAPDADRSARLRAVRNLAPVAGMASAALLSLEKSGGGDYANAFDLRFDLGADTSLRLYRQHALRKTMYQGASLTRNMGGGRSVLWEAATLETTPLLEGSFGVKHSVRTPRKHTAAALVHLPHIGAGAPIEEASKHLLMWTRETQGREHRFLKENVFQGRWGWRRKMSLAFLGESPVVDGLSGLAQAYDVRVELPLGNTRPYVSYTHNIDVAHLGGMLPDAEYLDTGDWWEMLSMDRSAGAGFTVSLPGGAALRYGLDTDRHFDIVRESISFSRNLGHDLELSAAWTHDRGVSIFTEPWQEHCTRVQLMRRRANGLSWGAFTEFRPGETIAGLALMRGAAPGDPLPFLPESRYREPFTNPDARWDFNTGSITCGDFASYADLASTLVTPELVSQYSKCLDYGDYDNNGPLNSPEEVFAGAEATCQSASWLQADILTRNGYDAYVVAFQSSQSVMGAETDRRFSINHAVTAYRDPETGAWNLIDYERIIRTGAPTIQQAMDIYSPNYLYLRVEEPDKLLPIGIYDSRTVQTLKDWVEAGH
jgi:hypothetical protein